MKRLTSLLVLVMLSGVWLVPFLSQASNIYDDPPQFSRPFKEASNTGFTAVLAPNTTEAVNEQTPDCSGAFCSYVTGGPSSSIKFNYTALELPAIYDATTQAINQTIWLSAVLVGGTVTQRQLRITASVCSSGLQLLFTGFNVPKTYTVFFGRIAANLTTVLSDICVLFLPFGLGAGETMRIAWTQIMLPPPVQQTITTISFDATIITILFLVIAFVVLLVLGFYERMAMVGAAIVSAIIVVLAWTWTGAIYISAVFLIMMAVCIGLSITKRV